MNDPFSAPPNHCPKCATSCDPDGLSCPKCGLVFVNFVPEDYRPSPALEALWFELLEHWEEAAAHQRLMGQAELMGELSTVARLYQIRSAQFPNDARAQAGREQVLKRVTLGLIPTPKLEPEKLRRRKWIIIWVASALLSLLSWAIMKQFQGGG